MSAKDVSFCLSFLGPVFIKQKERPRTETKATALESLDHRGKHECSDKPRQLQMQDGTSRDFSL